MFDAIFESVLFKKLSSKHKFFDFLQQIRILRWQLHKNNYPIYLGYPINAEPRYGYGKPPHQKLYEIISSNLQNYIDTLNQYKKFTLELKKIEFDQPADLTAPYWNNKFISDLEAISLYCTTSIYKPNLYIEIGSGNSTKFVRKAIQDQALTTKIISIDPYPRAEIDSICDQIIRQPLEEVDITLFDSLNDGDILMIDNSHCCFQNSDVTVVFLDILPRLKPGVLIYIDDIFLPYDYPPKWKSNFYSEQYLLAVLLLNDTSRYEIVLPCNFGANDPSFKSAIDDFFNETNLSGAKEYGNGFWMRTKTPNY